MTNRLLLDENHLVVSKAGFDATNPSLQEGDKLFDSTWLFSSSVVEVGLYLDPAPYKLNPPPQNVTRWDEPTDWSSPNIINFTQLDFVPTVMLISLADPRYWPNHNLVLFTSEPRIRRSEYYRTGDITVTNNQIIIPRIFASNSPVNYYKESFIYLIMGM